MGRIVKKKLVDAVLEEISQMIESGQLRKGDKLPNQYELAALLGVSRQPVREALTILETIGAIEQRPGLGTVFRGRDPILYADHLTLPLTDDQAATMELHAARRFIEMGCAELAVEKAPEEAVREIGLQVEEMDRIFGKGRSERYGEYDLRFHYGIAQASGNRFMVHLYVIIRRIMERVLESIPRNNPEFIKRSLGHHRRIQQALINRDKALAVEEMGQHMRDIQENLEKQAQVTNQATAG